MTCVSESVRSGQVPCELPAAAGTRSDPSVDHQKKTAAAQSRGKTQETETATGERRRLGRIVHDDRGNASVQWHDAPSDYERPVLELESSGIRRGLHRQPGSGTLSIDTPSFDPYASERALERKAPTAPGKTPPRTDLRKLSEWIKMMREIQERKQRGEDPED